MIILVKLILAHLIGDFLLQPAAWVRSKEQYKLRSAALYAHIAVHALLVMILLWDLEAWGLALTIMAAHGVIDVVKLYWQRERNRTEWFIADQLSHIIIVVACYLAWYQPGWDIGALLNNPALWIYATASLFLTVVSGIVIQVLLKGWSDQLAQSARQTGTEGQGTSLNNAGKYIGMSERLLCFLFIMIGQWQAIGFLIAAKSVFRFGDLKEAKDRKLTEYILIGTLLSFGAAIGAGVLARYLLSIC